MSKNSEKGMFAKMEEEVLDFWNQNKVFEASVNVKPTKVNGQNNEYVFYDGPPFANGMPHLGHMLTSCLKDTYARYQTSKGKRTERRFGWDCHGLPAEMSAEKELGVTGAKAIKEYGVKKFNDHCKKSVLQFSKEWEFYVNRQGRWVDFENHYKTMDKDYMETTIYIFKELYKKGLIYKGSRIMPYSWKAETPLSNFETRLDNSYREKISKSLVVKFQLKKVPAAIQKKHPKAKRVFLLAWTTTPWTLPSNLALGVHKDIDYALIPKSNDEDVYVVSAKLALNHYDDINKLVEKN